jgi:hypothetical protein
VRHVESKLSIGSQVLQSFRIARGRRDAESSLSEFDRCRSSDSQRCSRDHYRCHVMPLS